MQSSRRPARLVAVVAGLALALPLAAGAAAAAPAQATTDTAAEAGAVPAVGAGDEITFTGHGWGHGRGMGQYGALGYAVDHSWGYRQIVEHFYSNTALGSVSNVPIKVELMAVSNRQLRATGTGITINGAPVPAGVTGVVAATTAGNQVEVRAATGCGAAGAVIGTYPPGVEISTSNPSTLDGLIRLCEADGGERAYRGWLVVNLHPTTSTQVNMSVLPLEQYLRGVVPRESPASWGSLGGGRGMEALKAQAVVARSYVMAATADRPSGTTTCDTTSCQVYGGAARKTSAGAALEPLEYTNSDTAVAQTAGEVRLMAGGAIARTEFSSSTGGYTAGGAFPAVRDDGDDIASNPNRTWTTTTTTGALATRLGIPGPIRDIQVTARNGLGDWGGRATQLRVVDANGGVHTWSGSETIRTTLGLKSDWFTVSASSSRTAEAVVTALYEDLLGRGPEPAGLAGWAALLTAGTSQSALVTSLTSSDEYLYRRIRQAYVEVLGREPEPTGLSGWLAAIRQGRATVDDVQRVFYDSVEYYAVSGGTPEGYVARLYTTMLDRPAQPSEIATWVNLYYARGRAWVVDAIWWSAEAAERRAGVYYRVFLRREPDLPGVQAWGRVLLAQGEGAVRAGIAGSIEYRDLAIVRYNGG